jgi:hypothetical protein
MLGIIMDALNDVKKVCEKCCKSNVEVDFKTGWFNAADQHCQI